MSKSNTQFIIVSLNKYWGHTYTGPFSDYDKAQAFADITESKLVDAFITSLSSPTIVLHAPSLQAEPSGYVPEHRPATMKEAETILNLDLASALPVPPFKPLPKHIVAQARDVPAPGLAKLLRNILDAAKQIDELGKTHESTRFSWKGDRNTTPSNVEEARRIIAEAEDEARKLDPT